MKFFACKACAAKDAELERSHERELELMAMVKELQYAIHPARINNPSINKPQQSQQVTEIPQETEGDHQSNVPRGTSLPTAPIFLSGLQYGGHIQRDVIDQMRLRAAVRRGSLNG
jgi:hypothetical protein